MNVTFTIPGAYASVLLLLEGPTPSLAVVESVGRSDRLTTKFYSG